MIWVHLTAVVLALVIGALVLWRRKGDARHRLWGRVWVVLMLVGAISSFWITEINDGGFSPIHLLSAYTLFCLALGIYAIRKRHRDPEAISKHRAAMQSLYAFGLLIAGGFTFLPDRLLGRLTFGETIPALNFLIVAGMVGLGVYLLWRLYTTKGAH